MIPVTVIAAQLLSAPVIAQQNKPTAIETIQAEGEALEAVISSQIQPLIDAQLIPGAVVGVIQDGNSDMFAFGGVNSDGSGPIPTEHTLFEIGSITKVFTGILLAEMSEAGDVSLDMPIARLFPAGRNAPQVGDTPIQLWHLSAHASGLPGIPTNMPAVQSDDPYMGYTTDLMYDFLDEVTPARAPESSYEYSNLATGLLGRLLEQPANKTWAELIAARIFDPMGMTESFVVTDEAIELRIAKPSTEGLSAARWGGEDALAPCGAIVSSMSDMLKFANENLQPRDPESTLAKGLRTAHQLRFIDPQSGMAVGLGWHFNPDGTTLWHNGSTGGFSSMMLIDKSRGSAVVVLSNGAAAGDITLAGDAIMGWLQTGEVPNPPAVQRAREVSGEHLDHLVGEYVSPIGFSIHVTREGGRLGAQLTGQPRFRVYPGEDSKAPARFVYRVVEAALVFEFAEDGDVVAVTLEQNGAKMRAQRKD